MADVVTAVGKAYVAEKIGGIGTTTGDFEYLHIGSSGTAASTADTALLAPFTDSGLDPSIVVPTTDASNVLQLVHVWTCLTNSKTILECGVSSTDASGGGSTLLARSDFSSIAVDPGDSIQITYKVTVS